MFSSDLLIPWKSELFVGGNKFQSLGMVLPFSIMEHDYQYVLPLLTLLLFLNAILIVIIIISIRDKNFLTEDLAGLLSIG